MLPRGDVLAVDEDAERTDLLRLIARHGHTRYPVVRGSLDDAAGMLDARDVVIADDDRDWRSSIQPLLQLPDTTTVGNAIDQLLVAQQRLALVVDEYGNVDGMLALGDVLEFMAGPLPDDRRSRRREPRRLASGRWEVPGHYPVATAREDPLRLDVTRTNAESIGGLVAERLQRIPKTGDVVELSNARLHVAAMVGRRVTSIEFEPIEGDPGAGEPDR
jgi:putative hemolysin